MASKSCVLVVDDDVILLKKMVSMLSEAGYDVIQAENGKDGLNLALKNKPDLIIADLIMPEMDGFEMIDKLREDEWGNTVKVIVFTNADDIESLSKTIEDRNCDYFIKTDWHIEDIVDKVKEKLGK